MKYRKKISRFISSNFTVMIIPKTTKSTKQFKLNSLATYTILISFIVLTTFLTIYPSIHSVNLYNESQIIQSENALLNSQVKTYISEITILKEEVSAKSSENIILIAENKEELNYLNARIDEISTLRTQLYDLVSTFNDETDSNIKIPVSRSFDRSKIEKLSNTEINVEQETQKQNELVKIIEEQRTEYSTIGVQMEEKLEFLQSYPDFVPIEDNFNFSSGFGYRIHPITGQNTLHKGLDMTGTIGTEIMAAGAGTVTFSGWSDSYGRVVIISHGFGYETVYAHNSKLLVKKDQIVKKGELIAELGNTGLSTGPHLHFEVHKDKKAIDPKKVLDLDN